ncbi:nucleotidyltransferase family protein [Microbacterium sp. SSW1-49]|uniref:Nucleotidyltransferase family protein n=1 Tax=Microbacterium croceum TaxID=2851645 RepID=A0ABT0FCY1_9MICO|nr:nucleotidyltransferase family protein [Microbacterium croceum]MCK2035918.1 nucleotidyltransferase family protein [Microbacterium croceum]
MTYASHRHDIVFHGDGLSDDQRRIAARTGEDNVPVRRWIAVSNGAVDVRGLEYDVEGAEAEIAITPVLPGQPLVIAGDVAELWRSLFGQGVTDEHLSDQDRELVREFVSAGIADAAEGDERGIESIGPLWFESLLHELVSALVCRIAQSHDIRCLLIKGPTLHAQGLRSRRHSGDVDVLVDPARASDLVRAIEQWGWSARPNPMSGTPLPHSVTLTPQSWGCEIDVHFRYPGIGVDPHESFAKLWEAAEQRSFAGIDGYTPATHAHALIQALTLARPSAGLERTGRHGESASVLKKGGVEVLRLADQLDAVGALQREFASAFPESDVSSARPPDEWIWLSQPNPALTYLHMLRSVPLRDKASVLWKILVSRRPTADNRRESLIRRWSRGLTQLLSR